jgi:hypothetical protein
MRIKTMIDQHYPPPCVHTEGIGLCAACQEAFGEDPQAYCEYGDHPEGIANFRRDQEMIDADMRARDTQPPSVPDPSIPF